jgi:hypothetical protein
MRTGMLKTNSFTIGIVMLAALGVFVPSAVFAQHGPGMHAPNSDPVYDTTTEATFSGTVEDVKGDRSALYWLARIHTLGLGHTGVQEKQLLLRTETGTMRIKLGPSAFLMEKKVEIKKDDALEVTGSRIMFGESPVVLAREIRKGDSTWTLRDATGQPLWISAQPERRGFWTKKKVLLAIVAAKVVALATVLRH